MYIKKRKRKTGRGLWDSIMSKIFSDTGKKLATAAAESALKTAAAKGAEKLVESIPFPTKKRIEEFIPPQTLPVSPLPIDVLKKKTSQEKEIEKLFSGTSIKFLK